MKANMRVQRVNSLLRDILSQILLKEIKDPDLSPLTTIARVEVSNDISHAKVYVSAIGDEKEKEKAIQVLIQARFFITHSASKKVRLRIFPKLRFLLDKTADTHMHIDSLIDKVQKEREDRGIDYDNLL